MPEVELALAFRLELEEALDFLVHELLVSLVH
jgi:hypothetical protein